MRSPLLDMRIFLSDPWKFLDEPLRVYQEAELLRGHEFDKREARTKMAPFVSSLINTRNPQVTFLTKLYLLYNRYAFFDRTF